MPEQEIRLIRCFSSIFPTLTPEEIRATSTKSLGQWDSLTGVTLVAVVQEEFGLEIDLMDLAELNSFEAFHAYLRRLNLSCGVTET